MSHHPYERATILLIKPSKLIIREVRKIVTCADADGLFDDVVELEKHTVLYALGKGISKESILSSNIPLIGEMIVQPINPE